MLSLSDYDYTLPEQLIAQHPVLPPQDARLLVFNRQTKTIRDRHFYDLPELLRPKTLLVFNDSKVVKARLLFPHLGGEVLFLRLRTPTSCEALVKPGKKRKVGMTQTLLQTDITFTVTDQTSDGRILVCSRPVLEVLEQYGQMPLPPYITYDPNDAEHYQPDIADHTKPGSVAAPTAALHFGQTLLDQLHTKAIDHTTVTLHVGIGTFKTVDVEDITAYQIHEEVCEISFALLDRLAQQKIACDPILAVGTTSTRTLESLPYVWQQLSQEQKQHVATSTRMFWDHLTADLDGSKQYVSDLQCTDSGCTFACRLYIYPGFTFRIINGLITNFHLPRSSLLMLVAGYIGYDAMKNIYAHAIDHQYRFYSFGDGMIVI